MPLWGWLIVASLGTWTVLVWAFVAVTEAAEVRKKHDIHWVFAGPLILLGVFGVVADFLFNLIVGTIVFGERPKEWLFSHRVYRHKNRSPHGSRDQRRALWWSHQLNAFDPGHID